MYPSQWKSKFTIWWEMINSHNGKEGSFTTETGNYGGGGVGIHIKGNKDVSTSKVRE